MTEELPTIAVRGARTHNLKNINVTVPRGGLVVFTGVSGSGKSSLAFDTLFVEGQRRFVESLSPYVRQYLDQMPAPDVDAITGLPPTLSVRQSDRPPTGPRSTVGTVTEVYDYLRVLYARCGQVFCYQCGEPVRTQTIERMLEVVQTLPDGERLWILAPLVVGRKGQQREAFLKPKRDGFARFRVDGVETLIDTPPDLDPNVPHTIELVVDRIVVRPDLRSRLTESFQVALQHGDGAVIIARLDSNSDWVDTVYSRKFACRACGISYAEIEPRSFSFNSPFGACPDCQGLGERREPDWAALIDGERSLRGGAVRAYRTKAGKITATFLKELERWAAGREADVLDRPWSELPGDLQHSLVNGSREFRGLRDRLAASDTPEVGSDESDGDDQHSQASTKVVPCPTCQGSRLGPIARHVRVGGRTLPELTALPLRDAAVAAAGWTFPADQQLIADPVVREIVSRLEFLERVGVGYLTLDRATRTLSGGEGQRVRLARCLGAGLHGVCYVLDEPTIGLHPADVAKLMEVLERLRERRNTVLMVEHEPAAIRRADWLVDLGPGAGRLGGALVWEGRPADLHAAVGSMTADYLTGRRQVAAAVTPSSASGGAPGRLSEGRCLELRAASRNNLKSVDLSIPLGRLVAVTGVSGSGKSTLVMDLLVPALRQRLQMGGYWPTGLGDLAGWEAIARLVDVDQRPIGRSPRSIPATFTGLVDPLRQVFAQTRDARARGYAPSRFSFNSKDGQCPDCQGLGARKLDLRYLPDTYVPCDACRGQRFNRATLAIKFRGRSIAEVLALTVAEAAEFLANHPKAHAILYTLQQVGLDYLPLDQWATTLSGGEAQRLKLAAELAKPTAGPTLYVLDEPTTGLHPHDVAMLLTALRRLVAAGHTVVVIEHDLDLIAAADYVVDLGPGGGREGGQLVAAGTPEQIRGTAASATGRALADYCAATDAGRR